MTIKGMLESIVLMFNNKKTEECSAKEIAEIMNSRSPVPESRIPREFAATIRKIKIKN